MRWCMEVQLSDGVLHGVLHREVYEVVQGGTKCKAEQGAKCTKS